MVFLLIFPWFPHIVFLHILEGKRIPKGDDVMAKNFEVTTWCPRHP
jgi:hypothetical protein